jgi:hypothetical protein
MVYATGSISDDQGDLRLQASIFESPDSNLTLPYAMDPMEQGITLADAANAEIHVSVRSHGDIRRWWTLTTTVTIR